MEIFDSSAYNHIVAGRTNMSNTLWIGLSEAEEYNINKENGADVIIEFEKDKIARAFIELLEKELKGDDH